MKKEIIVFISFTQSKKYKTDWRIRTEYRSGYELIATIDEISKGTRFGETINQKNAQDYATTQANKVLDGFGVKGIISFI